MIVGKNNEMPQARNLCTCSGHSHLFRIRPSTIILTNAIIMYLDWFFYQTKIARWISSLWMCMSTNSENNSPGNPFCPNPDDWNCFLLKWISVWVIVFQSILLGRKVTNQTGFHQAVRGWTHQVKLWHCIILSWVSKWPVWWKLVCEDSRKRPELYYTHHVP